MVVRKRTEPYALKPLSRTIKKMGTVRVFGHFIRFELFMLMVFEFLILVLTLYAGALLRFTGEFAIAIETIGWPLPHALVFAVLMELGMTATGMYDPRQREGLRGTLFRVVVGLMLGAVSIVVSVYLFPNLYLDRGALVLATTVAFLGIGTVRALGFTSTGKRIFNQIFSRRVLVMGTGNQARSILEMRRRADWRRLELVGFARVEGQDCVIPQDKIVAINKPFADFATERHIDVIVVSLDEWRNECPVDQLLECKMIGIDVIDTATFFERQFGKVRLDLLRPSHFIFSDGFQVSSFYQFIKRCIDFVMSVVLISITWPIMLFTALAILLESGWGSPVFYQQIRITQYGKPFNILKYRSMRVDAEDEQGARWAQANDRRVTWVGEIIRKLRIDELPQIFNVLRGEMSFVGPRPERPEFVTELEKTIPFYTNRHRVKAGISGWAQLCYPYGSSEKDAREKLQYDLYYLKNNSVFLDLLILLQTVETVLFGKGAR